MNCKPGDLAIVVNDHEDARNNGALVIVLHRADPAEYGLPVDWECEAVSTIRFQGVVAAPGESEFAYRDCELRPIRPGDISDGEVRDLYAPKLPETISA